MTERTLASLLAILVLCAMPHAVPAASPASPHGLQGVRHVLVGIWTAQIPQEQKRHLEGLGRDLRSSFGGLLRTQLILMGMTFFELLLAFLLLHVRAALALAALTAAVDALPVFGTGTILLPWAAYCLLLGSTARALGLVLLAVALQQRHGTAQRA